MTSLIKRTLAGVALIALFTPAIAQAQKAKDFSIQTHGMDLHDAPCFKCRDLVPCHGQRAFQGFRPAHEGNF